MNLVGKNLKDDIKDQIASLPDRLEKFTVQPGFSARSLEIFVIVARTGSMSAAADHLGLTQPAVSQNISAFENALGIQLFDRSVRPPAITLQATALLQHASAVLDSLKKFENALRLGHLAQLPSLKIGMPNSVATTMGPQIIRRLRDIASEISIDSGYAATRFHALARREFDFIVTPDESRPPSDIQVIPFLTEPLLVVAPQSYTGRLEDLTKLNSKLELIRFGRDADMIGRLDRALQASGIVPENRYHFDTNEAVIQMVSDGSGWTVLPVLAVIKSIQRMEPIRVALYPGNALNRTLMVALRKGEGMHVAQQIHMAALETLRTSVLPTAERLLPKLAKRFILHEAAVV